MGNNKYKGCYTIDFESVSNPSKRYGRTNFNTLAQSGTPTKLKKPKQISGLGSDIQDKSVVKNKGKKMFITQSIVPHLLDIARKKGDKEMEKTLQLTQNCLNNLILFDNKLYGHYCKNRMCIVCQGIRKAKMINDYLPVIKNWPNPKLVTLTAKSCYAKGLKSRMLAMKRAFRRIKARCKKRHQRGKGPKFMGIKSLECNFNPTERTYNPHFHFIVPNWEIAFLLKREWMQLWPQRYRNGWAQDIRPIKDNLNGLIEVIKYGSKIFTEPDPNRKTEKKASHYVYVSALYNILSAMRGHRLFDRFGFDKPKKETKSKTKTPEVIDYDELTYHPEILDWRNDETGKALSRYIPDPELSYMLNHKINKTLE